MLLLLSINNTESNSLHIPFFLGLSLKIYRGLLHPPESVKEVINIKMFFPETFTIRDDDLLTNPTVTMVRTNAEFLKVITEACDGKTKDGAGDDGGTMDTAKTGPGDKPTVNPHKTKEKKKAVESAVNQNEEKAYRDPVKSDIKGLFTQDFIQYLAARLSKSHTADSGHDESIDDGAGMEGGPLTKKQRTLGARKKRPSLSAQFDDDDDASIQDSFAPAGSKRDRGQTLPIPPEDVSARHPLWDKVVEKVQITADTPSATCPDGLSLTRNELIRTMATNVQNIINGNIYYKLKEALVRYLLRVTLRPLGEQAYKSTIKAKAEEKQQLVESKMTKPAAVFKALRRKRRTLVNQLDRVIQTCSRTWSMTTLALQNARVESPDGDAKPRTGRVRIVLELLDINEKLILDHSRGHTYINSAALAIASPEQGPACNRAQAPRPVIGDEYLDEEDDEFGDEDDGYKELTEVEVEAANMDKTPEVDDDDATDKDKTPELDDEEANRRKKGTLSTMLDT